MAQILLFKKALCLLSSSNKSYHLYNLSLTMDTLHRSSNFLSTPDLASLTKTVSLGDHLLRTTTASMDDFRSLRAPMVYAQSPLSMGSYTDSFRYQFNNNPNGRVMRGIDLSLYDLTTKNSKDCSMRSFSISTHDFEDAIRSLQIDDDDDEKENAVKVLSAPRKKSSQGSVAVLGERCLSYTDEDCETNSICSSDDIIIEEEPEYKNRRPSSEESDGIPPEMLTDSDGDVRYYKDVQSIEDKTWLPRHFQGHKIRRVEFVQNRVFEYSCNRKCPRSASEVTDADLFNLLQYRYSRKSISNKKTDVMCRLCRGQNWIKKMDFSIHLALSHGVLSPPNLPACLLPNPNAMFEITQRSFINKFVECPKCAKWIRLGRLISQDSSGCRTHGLYYNYFVHLIKNHSDSV